MGWKLDDLPEHLRRQAEAQLANRPAGPAPKRKRHPRDEQVAEEETPGHLRPDGFTRPVRISYVDYRRKLLDADNAWTKFATDALVTAGVLRDDSTAEIPERPSCRQVKSKEEMTIITITEL